MFNTSAYRTPDGAMLEELVKKFPGAEVDDNGNITINGKQVKKIMVNGKEFFGGDVQTGMKNLPVEMIEKVKAYDKQSDMARITSPKASSPILPWATPMERPGMRRFKAPAHWSMVSTRLCR